MAKWQGILQDVNDIHNVHHVNGSYIGGHAIGILAVDMGYPKFPGNVVNATTYDYPVLYKKVSFPNIEQLFAGDPQLEPLIIEAAKELEQDGVRAIIGACGYFAHFQRQTAAAVDVPVFMSSLCQLPIIGIGMKPDQKILVMCASGDSMTQPFLDNVNGDLSKIIVQDVGSMDSFAPIRWDKRDMDNGLLARELAELAEKCCNDHPEIGSILLECSDLPPYAAEIQRATGKPVYDFISMINWAKHAVVQKRYYGFL